MATPSYSARAHVKAAPPAPFALREAETDVLQTELGPAFSLAETLPGVVPVFSGVPYLIIRGASPAGSLTYYDGMLVPTLFHMALGPSVIDPQLTGPTRLMGGAASVRYAAHLGGVLDRAGPDLRKLRKPIRYLRLSLLNGAGLLNVPTHTGSLTLAWRYGTPGLMLRALNLDATLSYYDYQLRYETALTAHTHLSLVVLGANDHLGERTQPADDISLNFNRVRARLTTRVRHFELGSSLLLSSDASVLGQQMNGAALRSTETVYLKWQNDRVRLHVGAQLISAVVKLARGAGATNPTLQDSNGTSITRRRALVLDPEDFLNGQPFTSVPNRNLLGAYAELRWTPHPSLQVTGGLRADAFIAGADLESALSPLLRARYFVTDALNLHAAVALTHKPHTSPVPLPGLNNIALDKGVEGALQSEVGSSWQLGSETTVEANVFYHRYQDAVYLNLILNCQGNTDPNASPGVRSITGAAESICRSDGLPTAHGDSYGFELFLKRELTQRLSGFLSYTHAYAHATARDGTPFVPQGDVRHILNAVLLYKLGAGLSLGARLQFRTGKVTVNPVLDLTHAQVWRLQYRLPAFFRLDLRLRYAFKVSFGRMTASVGIQNTTLSREATNRDCIAPDGELTCAIRYQPPIVLPNLALRADF